MSVWTLLGRTPSGVRGFRMDGAQLLEEVAASESGASLALLAKDGPVVRIGDGGAEALPVAVLPGDGTSLSNLEQESPPDVISGWVRLWVAGALASKPNWAGVIVVTHGDVTHWLQISADEVVSVQSVITQRLLTALGGADRLDASALADSMSQPERLAAHLRKADVTGDAAAATGHLMGVELAATRPYWLGQEVIVISEVPGLHMQALEHQAVPCTAYHPQDLLAAGLAALAQSLGYVD
ncbi:2-dehydro-3-deoxygalactonokinase [Roseovarius rhodophyticola]|uniref:2-dehydro-3-deoxygalactonokinase n=1 Tax=Roseovarius rhodophyticola TaxID=3080827 RepID=A0ABZ2TII1_9RHOB|nr:2-dehydro-3-deoxygalactonokinase [Roseovarius sp. W115]MDV2929742.1 2-dehydro-3-deoxygalactonokinase [Roseovarius sp. W115]